MDAFGAIGRFASRLLSDDSVFAGVQKTLMSTLDARRMLERNIERLLAGANLPSQRDLERVIVQLGELDRELAGLSRRVAALADRMEAEQGDPGDPGDPRDPRDPGDRGDRGDRAARTK